MTLPFSSLLFDKTNKGLRRAELFKKSKAYSESKSPSPILKQGIYFGWIQNVTQMFDFYFNWWFMCGIKSLFKNILDWKKNNYTPLLQIKLETNLMSCLRLAPDRDSLNKRFHSVTGNFLLNLFRRRGWVECTQDK